MNLFILFGFTLISIALIDASPVGENAPKTSVSAGSYAYVDSTGKSHQIAYTKDSSGIHFNSANIPEADVPKIIAEIEKQSSFSFFPAFNFPFFHNQEKRSDLFESGVRQPIRAAEDAPLISVTKSAERVNEEPILPKGAPNEVATILSKVQKVEKTETSSNNHKSETTMLVNPLDAKTPKTPESSTFILEQAPLVYEEYTKEDSPIDTYIYLVESPLSELSNAYNTETESFDEATVYTAKLQHQLVFDYINAILKSH